MYLEQAKAKFAVTPILQPKTVIPCTPEDIKLLEQHLGLRLPAAYQEFLLWMGRGTPVLFAGSQCWYNNLIDNQEIATEMLGENSFPETLPVNAFVFFVHQGYQFNFFVCNENNPVVYRYHESYETTSFKRIYEHFSDFLDAEIDAHIQALTLPNR